ncbi:MAG: hypothetical protein D6813_03570 [Calditrichaeota bacterium]|nr:MAG: hypothetical protein D6813_03570 [Calditrichota bacterium]
MKYYSKTPGPQLWSIIVVFCLISSLFAGGPLNVDPPTGKAFVWDVTKPVPFNPDQGGLGFVPFGWNNATAVSMTEAAFNKWQEVATASVTYINAGPLSVDVDETNFDSFLFPEAIDGLNPIVFDEDGAIFELLFGAGTGIIGFATPEVFDLTNFLNVEGLAFLNGAFMDGDPNNREFNDPQDMFKVMVHEFGHYSGLAHSVVNGQALILQEDTGFGVPAPEMVEIMYPFSIDGQGTDPMADDRAILSTLYPEKDFITTTGTISGHVFFQNGVTPANGVNVIVRSTAHPFLDAVSAISGDFIAGHPDGNPDLQGLYNINGLSPGENYRVEIDQILFGGFSTNPLFPFVGPEEYYNGPGESSDPTSDIITEFDPVTPAAGTPVNDINIIFNNPFTNGNVIFQDDMEKGINGWTVEGSTALWHQTTNRSVSSSTSWYYGQEELFNYDTGSVNSGRLVSPDIDLTSATSGVILEFFHFADMEGLPFEHPIVQISEDGGVTWNTIFEENATTGFVPRFIDLSAFAGKTIKICFFFDTGDGINNSFEGWYIDNIRIVSDPTTQVGPLVLEEFLIDDGALGFGGSGNGDGIPNPGESIDIPITIRNDGSLDAFDVEARLIGPFPPFIEVLDEDVFLGNIAPGASQFSFDFDVLIDAAAPAPGAVELKVSINAGNMAGFTTSFTLNLEPLVLEPLRPGSNTARVLFIGNGGIAGINAFADVDGDFIADAKNIFADSLTPGPATGVQNPVELAFDGNGDLLVSSGVNGIISVYKDSDDPQNFFADVFHTWDSGLTDGDGMNIHVNDENIVFIGDLTGAVRTFQDINGDNLPDVSTTFVPAPGVIPPSSVVSIGFSKAFNNTIYVIDAVGNQILTFSDTDGDLIADASTVFSNGIPGAVSLTVDQNENVYVVDSFNGSIEVLTDTDGNLIADNQITFATGFNFPFSSENGITLDPAGNVYVIENMSSVVVLRDFNADFIADESSIYAFGMTDASGLTFGIGKLPELGTLYASTGGRGNSLITVDPTTGVGSAVGPSTGFGPVSEIEFREDATLFGSTGGGNSSIITFNLITGTPSLVGIHDFGVVNGLEFDVSGTLFGTFVPSPGSPSQLVTVNQATGSLTFIGPTGFQNVGGLTFAPDGTLYGVTSGPGTNSDLITINTETGAGTLIGETGFTEVSALEFGPDGLLYGGLGGRDPNAGSLIIIDRNTGQGTLVGPTGFPVISGLSFVPRGILPDVLASAVCPLNPPEGCPIKVEIHVDLTNSDAPDDLLGSFSGSLSWDPSLLEFTGASLESGFTGFINQDNVKSGELLFNGTKPSGVAGDILILNVEFVVKGSHDVGSRLDLDFSAMAAAVSFNNLLPKLGVNDCAYTIGSPLLLGDINGDDQVNSTDALICLTFDVGNPIPPEFEERINKGVGDVNQDGITNSTDCLILLSFDAGLTVPFPLGEAFCPASINSLTKVESSLSDFLLDKHKEQK